MCIFACGPGEQAATAQTRYGYHRPKAKRQAKAVATTESSRRDTTGAVTPTRTEKTVFETPGKKISREVLETPSIDGRFEGFIETEEETVRIDAKTIRIIRRRVGRDADGRRKIIEVQEEVQTGLPGGGLRVTRTFSTPDLNGRLEVNRKEVQEKIPINFKVNKLKGNRERITIFRPDINHSHGMSAVEQTERISENKEDGALEVKTERRVPDANGKWETFEVRKQVVRESPGETTTTEDIYRRGAEGKISLTDRKATLQRKIKEGKEEETIETYSVNIEGKTRYGDNRLHLDRRQHTVRITSSDGTERTVREVFQRQATAPTEKLKLTERGVETSRPASKNRREIHRTVYFPDPDGRLRKGLEIRSQETKR